MSRYETVTSKAEAEVIKILTAEGRINRPWQLVGYSLSSRTLKTTCDEAKLLIDRDACLRPGYEAANGTVYVPNLFVKFAGNDDYGYLLSCADNDKGPSCKSCAYYDSVKHFGKPASQFSIEPDLTAILDEQGLIDKQRLFDSRNYRYGFLRKEYQEIIADKINYIVRHRNDLFLKPSESDNVPKIIFSLLNLNDDLVMLFNNFDFQRRPPRVIIRNDDRGTFNDSKAYILMLLNLLGFDIIIFSPSSYADVENVIAKDSYDVFYMNNTDKNAHSFKNIILKGLFRK